MYITIYIYHTVYYHISTIHGGIDQQTSLGARYFFHGSSSPFLKRRDSTAEWEDERRPWENKRGSNNGFQPVACQTVNNGLYMVMNNGLLMVIIWLMMVNHNLVAGIPTIDP